MVLWLNDCHEDFKPVYHRRYVDDTFALFRSPDDLENFRTYLNSKHKNITFTYYKECLFLYILISRSENGFKVSIYAKPTFSWIYSNFNSFFYEQYKIGLILTVLFRIFSNVSDFSGFTLNSVIFKERILCPSNWLTIALKLFRVKSFCILQSH